MSRTRVALALCAAAALAATLAAPAAAISRTTVEQAPIGTIAVLDASITGVLFVNTSRAAYCTPERLVWEQAAYDWQQILDNPAPFPEEPVSEGISAGTRTLIEVRPHVLVTRLAISDAPAELWSFNPGIDGEDDLTFPCLDSTEADAPSATGTSTWRESDNDYFGYEVDGRRTRGNAFMFQIAATVSGAGGTLRWTGNFHNRITPDGDYRFAGGERVVTTR